MAPKFNNLLFSSQIDSSIFSASYDVSQKYDAYEKDIAVVTFYFETNSVFEYSRQESQK